MQLAVKISLGSRIDVVGHDVFTSFRGRARADISLLVPRHIALKFGVVSASALISGLAGDARVSTVAGDIVIDGVTGSLELNTVNGEISVQGHTGPIVSSDVTASGRIPTFSADGVSSNVFLDIAGAVDALTNNTVSGDFTVRLDARRPLRRGARQLRLGRHHVDQASGCPTDFGRRT